MSNDLGDAGNWTCDEELIHKCLERFLYVRCYDSLEFLATLKVRNVNSCLSVARSALEWVFLAGQI